MFVNNDNASTGMPGKKKEQCNILPPVGHVSHLKTNMGDSFSENHFSKLIQDPTNIGLRSLKGY